MKTKHFTPGEGKWFCPCGCGFNEIDREAIVVLELVRHHFNAPVTISSGNRCEEYNATIPGSAKGSKHTKGIAVDIKVKGVEAKDVYDFLCDVFPSNYGIGLYNNWVHFDCRTQPARWGAS